MAMFCLKCGNQINDGDLFCRKCGFKLTDSNGENVYTNGAPDITPDEMPIQHEPSEIPALRSAPLPQKPVVHEKESFIDKYLNADGRLNRKPYFIRLLILNIISMAPTLILYASGGPLLVESMNGFLTFFHIIIFVLSILLMVGRLHDLNRSGWFSLLIFIPLINCVLFLILLFCRGTKGSNRFGPDPLELEY